MIRCPYCGVKNKDTFEYCVRCSEPLDHGVAIQPSRFRVLLPLVVVAVAVLAAVTFWRRTGPADETPSRGPNAGLTAEPSAPAPPRPFDAALATVSSQQGLEAFRDGDYETAANLLEQFVQEAPDNPWGHMYLSFSYEKLGDQEAAIRAMRSAFDIAPRSLAFERYLVSMLRKSGQNAEAEEVLRRHLEVYPDDDSAKVELARTMRAEGRTEEAIAAMEAVVAQYPENLDARLELGESLKTEGRGDEAAAAFRGAAEAHPDSAVAHHAWGVTELATGNFEESLKPLQDAVRLDSENGSYRFSLAQAYENLDKIPESLAEYEAFLHLAPDDPLAPKIGQLVKRARAALAERQAQGRSGGSTGS